jgi:hypothetical protein
MSSVLAQFILYPALIHSRVSKQTLEKIGILEDSKRYLFPDLTARWDRVDDDEKKQILSIPHERMHFFDLTSFPNRPLYP